VAEARNARVHESRIHRSQGFVAHAETLGHTGTCVLHQHVGCFDQRIQHVAVGGILQVQRDAALVSIQRQEAGTVLALETKTHRMTRRVADLGRLDLDDIGAHVTQQHAAEWPRHDLRNIQYADAGQGQRAIIDSS
jgi:hypothetical protein